MPTASEILSDPKYGLIKEVRPSQIQMATTIEEMITTGGVYVVEAPVGVGKSYAYGLPSILNSTTKRIVIATPKKSLQDQLLYKDLPALERFSPPLPADPLGRKLPLYLMAKGKANYTCRAAAYAQGVDDDYRSFISGSTYGDVADWNGSNPLPVWWGQATAEGCEGPSCVSFDQCGYIKLKRELSSAKVVVANHHLVGSDFYYGHGKMLGGPYSVLVIDEAHKFAEGIRAAFTHTLVEDSPVEIVRLVNSTGLPVEGVGGFGAAWTRLFESLPNKHWREIHERTVPVFKEDVANEMINRLQIISSSISGFLGPGKGLDGKTAANLQTADRRVSSLLQGLKTMQGRAYEGSENEDFEAVDAKNERILANTVIYAKASDDRVRSFSVATAPINVGPIVKRAFADIPTVIFTSATLALRGRFDHLTSTLGSAPTKTDVLPPSFNYEKQGVLYIPSHIIPEAQPSSADQEAKERYDNYIEAAAQECVALIRASRGNAFILTTANEEMYGMYTAVKRALPSTPIFMQRFRRRDGSWVGDGDPAEIKRRYLETPNSVLFGSKSFWEGIDVSGGKLTCVIIPKLPFASPKDPISQARCRGLSSAFEKVTLPDMIIDLRQGAGRLIRSAYDDGVVAILDGRIWTKNYKDAVLDALPWPMSRRTKSRADAVAYLTKVVVPKFATAKGA